MKAQARIKGLFLVLVACAAIAWISLMFWISWRMLASGYLDR